MVRPLIDFLVVARDNNYGLSRDAAILCEAIGVTRASAAPVRSRSLFDALVRRKVARTIIHVERAHARWLAAGERNWLLPNQERFPRRHLGRLRRIDRVLAKTRHAEAIFAALGAPTAHLGFTSADRRAAEIEKDWSRFFHLAGANTLKGTEDVLALWAAHPEWPELVLVQKAGNAPAAAPPNVRLLSGYIDDAELRRLQNACGVHLCPSRAEGWGHHIVEGLSTGAVVVTTDAPPMNELVTADCGLLAPASRAEPRHLGESFFIDRAALEAAIEGLTAMPAERKRALGAAARRRYEEIDANFLQRVNSIFDVRIDQPTEAS